MDSMASRNRASPPSSYSSSSSPVPAPHHLRPEIEENEDTRNKRFAYQRSKVNNSSNARATKILPSGYFSVESLILLIGLTASLLILPLVLPPLPPPPFLLLLIPIGILFLLMVLAFTPSNDFAYTAL